MCYAFSETMEQQLATYKSIDTKPDNERVPESAIRNDVPTTQPSLKRPAEVTSEQPPAKVAKLAHDNDAPDLRNRTTESHARRHGDKKVAELEEQLMEARERIAYLGKTYIALKGRLDEAHFNLYEFQAKEEVQQRKKKEEQGEVKATAKATIKKAEDAIRAEHSQKVEGLKKKFENQMQAQKAKYESKIVDLKDKHTNLLESKVAAHKQKIDEMKDKAQQNEKELKEAKAKHADDIKALKAEHQKAQKELKAEQSDEIKNWRPEHSKTVKEKDSLLKEKLREISDLQQAQGKDKQKIEELESALVEFQSREEKLTKVLALSQKACGDLQGALVVSRGHARATMMEKETLQKAHEVKIAEAGKRWQMQYDKAEKVAHAFAQLQRTNFVLRTGVNSKNEKIEALEAELLVVKEQIASSKKAVIMNDSNDTTPLAKTAGEDGEEESSKT